LSKKLDKDLHRSCWGASISGAPPTSPRVQRVIERRPTGVEKPVLELLSCIEIAFPSETEKKPSYQALRHQYVDALAAVYRFLITVDPVHANRFLDLGDAIADLNVGAPNPLLENKLKSHPTRFAIRRAKAEVVFAVEALIEAGMEPCDAAKDLLKKFPAIKILAGQKSHNQSTEAAWVRTILEWRKTLSAPSRRKDPEAELTYQSIREYIASHKELWLPGSFRRLAYDVARDVERISRSLVPPKKT
jgi:hypothetical protein